MSHKVVNVRCLHLKPNSLGVMKSVFLIMLDPCTKRNEVPSVAPDIKNPEKK